MVDLQIEAILRLEGEESEEIVRSILPENRKYIKCRKSKSGFLCRVSGDANNVRKTINEFLESVMFIDKVNNDLKARVG
ncbi:MAG: hypothetical protein M1526_06395 [Candidatus Thermoplasmatota archaeon]|nr:hypothetical protein [Candidatus Thermoplasmatota archaeon]